MTDVPAIFRERITEHNQSCWAGAVLALLGAGLSWLFVGALYYGGVLLFDTVRTGETNLLQPPIWCFPVGGGLGLTLLAWGIYDRWRRRYRPTSDRSIIGWHLFSEVMLVPPRSTFAIYYHWRARITLSRREIAEAWRLLVTIFEMERADAARLSALIPDANKLPEYLMALQLSDWIDLHRGEDDWFYKVRSSNDRLLRELTSPQLEDEDAPPPSENGEPQG